MQRLFGTFPNRGAGVALLILRLAVAAALISGARLCPGPETEVLLALSRIAAVLIIVGWYTPLAAVSAVLVSLCTFWVCREPGVNVAHDRYTGRHWFVRGGCLFCGCKAIWKAQVGGRTPAR